MSILPVLVLVIIILLLAALRSAVELVRSVMAPCGAATEHESPPLPEIVRI